MPNINRTTSEKSIIRPKKVKGDNQTIRVQESPSTYTISLIRKSSGRKSGSSSSTSLCYLCKITGGNSTSYTIDLYANGKDAASTGTGTLQVANMHINETLPVGTWVVGHPAIVTEIAGD